MVMMYHEVRHSTSNLRRLQFRINQGESNTKTTIDTIGSGHRTTKPRLNLFHQPGLHLHSHVPSNPPPLVMASTSSPGNIRIKRLKLARIASQAVWRWLSTLTPVMQGCPDEAGRYCQYNPNGKSNQCEQCIRPCLCM